jgi:hypothetical protein
MMKIGVEKEAKDSLEHSFCNGFPASSVLARLAFMRLVHVADVSPTMAMHGMIPHGIAGVRAHWSPWATDEERGVGVPVTDEH